MRAQRSMDAGRLEHGIGSGGMSNRKALAAAAF